MKNTETPVILVTGASGQIGTELCAALRQRYGQSAVIATDIRGDLALDVLDKIALEELVRVHGVTHIYHLAAMLSARGEQDPLAAWKLNMDSLLHVLELARQYGLKVFWPSSIAVFGPDAPKKACPQDTQTNPQTIYGISKLAGEQLCAWYKRSYGVDVRSIRYPGLISYSAPPGGGTTDYAVEIFHEALKNGRYTCFLKGDTALPMLYMADAVRATLELMDAPPDRLRYVAYNLGGLSFTPADLANEIAAFIPNFKIDYRSDQRQQIADSWPASMNDSAAAFDWRWKLEFDLELMTAHMLQHLREQYALQLQL